MLKVIIITAIIWTAINVAVAVRLVILGRRRLAVERKTGARS